MIRMGLSREREKKKLKREHRYLDNKKTSSKLYFYKVRMREFVGKWGD